MPIVERHLEKYQRALASVRRTHRGRPVAEVRETLAVAFEAEGIQVWDEVVDDAARLISSEE
ncbi:hypothetical protein G7043_09205 [Lentzea sp. NEAU-D13]|uniref:PXA domain-containing protein n=1 Tax=Lentzea alba TaxID=2714351 RepID=A0A7C9RRW9_9PSEU|nr:hypothetical protein [Lentzea alba]NGY59102.1 hypothetical protein [Lentzea alba]